jgi:hypothetical protein
MASLEDALRGQNHFVTLLQEACRTNSIRLFCWRVPSNVAKEFKKICA